MCLLLTSNREHQKLRTQGNVRLHRLSELSHNSPSKIRHGEISDGAKLVCEIHQEGNQPVPMSVSCNLAISPRTASVDEIVVEIDPR